MQTLWSFRRGIDITQVDKHLFLLTLHNAKDVQRILKREPWPFDKRLILLKQVSGVEQFGMVPITKCGFWIKLYDVPICLRTNDSLTTLASKIGTFVSFDGKGMVGHGSFVKILVLPCMTKLLHKPTVSKVGDSPVYTFPITYDNLSIFCYACGCLGHGFKECPDFTDSDSDNNDAQFPYGP
ncbi:hypothetical protein Tsubulata_027603 [Turnera subulata]|uniref:CCHC-type domain-containing protein n=1 Tax=Turnera subulata TaxID=218843 RepID=A0A9Q0G1L9_9ROSI|nr:hypothetical protein Tsubulata_027603 [Turnera subulata]